MRNIVFLLSLIFTVTARAQWYYGAGKAVNLENDIGFNKNSQLIKSGVTVDPKVTAVSGGAGSLILKTDGTLYVKKDSGSSTNWNKFLDDTFNVITALGYTPENAANKGVPNGYASLDASGLIPITQIPPAALERLVVVADQTARYALTTATVQNGDTVKQVDTGEMWFVKDDTNLNNANGYAVYTAGTASAVSWSGITGMVTSSATLTGVLSSTDWNTFNGKENVLSFSSPLVRNTNTISLDTTKTRQFGGAVTTPTFTDNGAGSVTINSVQVNLWSDSAFTGDASTYTVGPITQTLTDNTTSYVVADYNAGSPIMRITTDVNEITEANITPIFTIYRSGTVLHTLDWDTLGKGLANKTHQSIVKTQRYRRESGLSISEAATRLVNLTSGIVWVGANKQPLTSIASSTDNIQYFLRTGSSAWTQTSVTQYNNTDYWNGTTTASVSNNRYVVNWLYRGVESQKHLYMVLGEGDYTLTQAQASQPPASLPGNITSHGLLVGRIIVLKGAITATQIDSAFNVVFTQGAASIHNDLGGLQGGTAGEYYHLTQGKYNAVENLTASGTQTNFTGDVQSTSCVYYGSSTVDGSYRDCSSGGALIRSKRVSGSWSEVYRVE